MRAILALVRILESSSARHARLSREHAARRANMQHAAREQAARREHMNPYPFHNVT